MARSRPAHVAHFKSGNGREREKFRGNRGERSRADLLFVVGCLHLSLFILLYHIRAGTLSLPSLSFLSSLPSSEEMGRAGHEFWAFIRSCTEHLVACIPNTAYASVIAPVLDGISAVLAMAQTFLSQIGLDDALFKSFCSPAMNGGLCALIGVVASYVFSAKAGVGAWVTHLAATAFNATGSVSTLVFSVVAAGLQTGQSAISLLYGACATG